MRKVVIASVLLLCASTMALWSFKRSDLFLYQYWVEYQLKRHFYGQDKLVLLGDSHLSRGEWDGLKEHYHVINLAVGGSTVAILANQLEAITLESDVLLVHIGINDLRTGKTVQSTYSNLEILFRVIKQHCHSDTIIVSGIIPVEEIAGVAPSGTNRNIHLLNDLVERLARENQFLFFASYEDEDAISPYLEDGLHLNRQGYDYFTEALLKFLK